MPYRSSNYYFSAYFIRCIYSGAVYSATGHEDTTTTTTTTALQGIAESVEECAPGDGNELLLLFIIFYSLNYVIAGVDERTRRRTTILNCPN